MKPIKRIQHLLSTAALTATLAASLAAASLPAQAAPIPGMRGIQHIGITVPNMKEAVAFFKDILACEPSFTFGAFKFEDDWMARHLDVHPRAAISDFQMVRCGNGTNLEVFEYTAPDQNRRGPRNSDIGGHHLAFYVDDMDAAVAYLKGKGVRVLDTPSTFTEGPAAGLTWVYFLSPWGLQLELVSAPKGMAHEKTLQRKLWDPRFPDK
ncbi:MAG: VOC family protein [Azoarcus sp.]|nr:VOC family protein [Azoarcus sp.]PKO56033.1 MAG: glyoxalase [Betaproteobacteria bacterium HGW-Betaproteobacteria-21]